MDKPLPFYLKSLLTAIILLLSVFAMAQTPDANGIVYVTPNGGGNGSSWNAPTADLQGAINSGATKVFVAIGNYDAPANSFSMKSGVSIYGGFDPADNIKTLSDNRILPNKDMGDGSVLNGNNARTVIKNDNNAINSLTAPAILDGFTVTGGYATNGAGILNNHVAPRFNNLVIRNNTSTASGAGMHNTSSPITITNSIIRDNTALSEAGAGMYNIYVDDLFYLNAPITISYVTMKNNAGSEDISHAGCGIMYSKNVAVNVTNTYIYRNAGTYGIVQTGSRGGLTVTNVTMAVNRMVHTVYIDGATATFNNSLMYDIIENINGSTIIANNSYVRVAGDYTDNNSIPGSNHSFDQWFVFNDYEAGDYTLKSTSPAINRGDNTLYTDFEGNNTDLIGNPRLSGTAIDLGAYEYPLGVITPVNGIVYVRPTATGKGMGSSWDDAMTNLNSAIQANGVQKVFVAKGTYNAPANGFVMKNGVEIYGGFDPDNNIKTLNDQRILPSSGGDGGGSILNGQNTRPVIWNNNNGVTSSAVLDGFTITGGSATEGAGIYNQGASPTLRNLVVRNNKATERGGGMYNYAASPTVSNVVFAGNSVVSTSGATVYGGAVYNGNFSEPVMTNITIADNVLQSSGTESGAGIYNDNSSPKIYNSIIWNNTKQTSGVSTGADIENWESSIVTLKNSITQSYTTDSSTDNVLVNFNPLFADASNGNYKLSATSPAVDGGSNTLYTGLGANSKDLAGNARVYNYATGGIIDMGAYESLYNTPLVPDANRIIYVKETATGTGRGNSWENAMGDLHTAITTSNVSKVFVAVGNYNVGSSSFVMKNGVAIYGGFDPDNNIKTLNDQRILPTVTLSGVEGSVLNGQNTRRVISNSFTSATALNSTAILDGFTITNGKYTGNGAGIYNYYASPTLRNLVIRNNQASTAGGGIYNNLSSAISLSNSVVKNNSAQYGGGIYNNSSASTFTNVSITGNTATLDIPGAGGGGIFNENANLKLTNVLIAGNSTAFQGGGFRNLSGNPVFTNVTVVNNNASTNTAIEIAGGTLQLNNSLVFGESLLGSYTAQYSLIQGDAGGSNGNLDGWSISDDVVFSNAPGGDYTLKNTSPALNVGSNQLYWDAVNGGVPLSLPLGELEGADLAGNLRVYNYANGGIIDLGAYESTYHSPLTPDASHIIYVKETATGTGSGNTWDNATADLQNAILTADVQKVFVALGNYNVGSSSFLMKNNVEIYGGFDPDNNIKTLNDTRILPNVALSGVEGSVLNGQNARRVIFNNFASGTALNNTAVLDGFTIMNGKSTGSGAGIYNYYASPTLRNLVIRNNEASTAGGGIYNNLQSAISLSNSVIKNNSAQYGGGIYNNSSASTLTNVSITENTATLATTGAGGGGIFNENANLKLTNVLIADNHANFQGGGFRNLSGNPVFTNVTLAGNTAGVNYTAIEIAGGTPQINNAIVYGTFTGNYTAKYSLIEGLSSTVNGNQDATGFALDAVFNSPPTGDYTLKYPSPAIDMGSNTLFTGLDENTKDLAGNARVSNFNSSGIIDIGAYESDYGAVVPNAGVLYVKPTATGRGDGNSWEHATADLQTAINTAGVQKVFVAIGNYNAPDNGFVMKNGVAIYGGFDPDNNIKTLSDQRILPTVTLSGVEGSVLNGQNTRIVITNSFDPDNPMDNTAVLNGFTIKNGKGSANGGGMYNQFASPTIANCSFIANTAYYNGGAMFNINTSSPVLTNCSFTGNTAGDGYNGGAMYNVLTSSPVITNCIFTQNSATNGGAIGNSGGSLPELINCLITGNSATAKGGGVYNYTGDGTFTNVTLANNGSNGFYAWSNTTLQNSIIWDTITETGYTASNSLIKDKTDINNGNISATGITETAVFTNATGNDYTLKEGSPVINKGNNGLNSTTVDLAENERLSGGTIDLGAYEYQETTLPVSLTSFTAKADGNHAKLQWQTASENNNKGFEIYRSGDDGLFVKLGEIQASQISNPSSQIYSYTDYSPLNGNNYYKLVQIDNDGKTTDLGVRTVSFSLSAFSLQLYPNPTEDLVNLSFETGRFTQLQVIDLNGKVLQHIAISPNDNSKTVSLGIYPAGMYIIKLNGNGKTESRRVVKR